MPKRTTSDDETPRRRRRGAAAAAVESERGFVMRLVLRSPKDVIAGLLAFAAISAIVTNALFLQAGPHPAPMFGSFASNIPATVSPLPRPRPAEADATEARPAEPKLPESKLAEPKATEHGSADPLSNLVRSTASIPTNVMRPPAPIPLAAHEANSPAAARRVAAVQRALTEYGYGQLKPTGTVGADTQAAIQKFERERKLPVTGQVSERLVHELSTVIGHPID